jgi:hypothetical protein
LTNFRNQVVITTQFTNRGRFELIILPIIVHAILAALFIASLWLSYYVGLQFWLGLVEGLIYDGYWLNGLLGFLGFTINLYVLWMQFQLVKSY